MTDPSRLMEGDVAFERAVLSAWRGRQPSENARQRTLAAVGVGGLVLTAAAKASASVAPKAILVSSALLKWLAVGAGVVIAAGAVSYATLRTPPEGPAQASTTQAPLPMTPTGATPNSAAPLPASPSSPGYPSAGGPHGSGLPTPAGAPAPGIGPGSSAPPAAPGAAAAPSPVTTKAGLPAGPLNASLDDEVLAIDQARRALAAGDAAAALDLVNAYDARYPAGALAQESAELRIEALFRAGRRAEAEKLAEGFLAAHPTSPYARVIRSLASGARRAP